MSFSNKICFICNDDLKFSKSPRFNLNVGVCKNKSCNKHNLFNYKVYSDSGDCYWFELKINKYIIEKVISSNQDNEDYHYRVFIKRGSHIPALVINLNRLDIINDYYSAKSKLDNIISIHNIYS